MTLKQSSNSMTNKMREVKFYHAEISCRIADATIGRCGAVHRECSEKSSFLCVYILFYLYVFGLNVKLVSYLTLIKQICILESR